MKKDTIETKVDKLVEYVNMRGEVPIALAAEALQLPVEQVEEWAKPLEENEMIKIKYSPLHGMILVSNTISKKELGTKLWQFKDREKELKKAQEGLEAAFDKYNDALPELEFNINEVKKKYAAKLKEVKTGKSKKPVGHIVDELQSIRQDLEGYEKELNSLQKEKQELNRTIDNFKKDLLTVEKRSGAGKPSKELGTFYEFLSKAEDDLIKVKKKEEKFIGEVVGLKSGVDDLIPKVQPSHKKEKKRFNIFKL